MTENLLVTTDWLAAHLNDENLKVVDIRGKALPADQPPPHYFSHHAEYNESHIPNAVFVDWTSDIVEPGSASYDIANPERYAKLMSNLGIGDGSFVLAYDDADGMFAARFWWTMRYYGHENVAILDGGWQKWLKEERPISSELPQIEKVTFTPKTNASVLATGSEIEQGKYTLIDVRSVAEFNGESSRAVRKGHIPNAINMPRSSFVSTEGIMKDSAELREMFATAGIKQSDLPIATYCNAGISASYVLIALHLAGIQNGSVYDSSWKEWGNDDSKPIE